MTFFLFLFLGLGENICVLDFDTGSPRKAGEQLVKEWYREIENYNYNNPGWKKGKSYSKLTMIYILFKLSCVCSCVTSWCYVCLFY